MSSSLQIFIYNCTELVSVQGRQQKQWLVLLYPAFFDKEEYILKLGQKKWKSLVSGVLLAASASSFLIAPVFAGEYSEPLTSAASEGLYAALADQALEFTSTLTGVAGNDAEYANAGVIKSDGSYKFTKDASITTSKTSAIEVGQDLKLIADQNLKLTVANNEVFVDSLLAGVKNDRTTHGSMSVQAKKLVINVDQTDAYMGAAGIYQQGKSSGKVTGVIDADIDANIKAVGAKPTYGIASIGSSELTVNGNVTMKGADGFGITNNDQNDAGAMNTGLANAVGLFANKNSGSGIGGILTVNGNVDLSVDGNAIYAKSKGSKITVNGDVKLVVNPNAKYGDYAIDAMEGSTVNVNMNEAGDASADHKVNIQGNVAVMADMFAGKDTTAVNLGLSTKDSTWQGIVYNTYVDNTVGSANIWLSNGASWTNESFGKVQESGYAPGGYDEIKFAGSHVTKLVGGSDAAHAGNIFQNDEKNLTIGSYSGNTNIYYAHTGNGEAADNYAAGDTIIKHAEKDSVVSLITDNSGVNMSSADSIVNVLNSLAGKLTYSNFTKDENNLTGYVKIADGLTSSSAAMYTGDMAFSKEDGKGSLKNEDSIRPDLPAPKSDFTTTLTGVAGNDAEYANAGVIKSDGSYKFTKDASITRDKTSAIEVGQDLKLIADQNLKLTVANNEVFVDSLLAGVKNDRTTHGSMSVQAKKLVINVDQTDAYMGAAGIYQQGKSSGKVTGVIDADIDANIKAVGAKPTYGIASIGSSELTVNGNVTMKGADGFGITNNDQNDAGAMNTGLANAVGLFANKNSGSGIGGILTVNGNVDLSVDGNAIYAKSKGSKITVNGDVKLVVNPNAKYGDYAIDAMEGSTVNVNMNEAGDASADHKVNIQGNVAVMADMFAGKDTTAVNLGLSTKDSTWQGIVYNTYVDNTVGSANIWLSNGASWTNESFGKVQESGYAPGGYDEIKFAGSHVTKLVGGSDAAHAGNIFQNDEKNLTIGSYSGNTNIYYAHTGNGEAADNYAAGDTIIKHAEKDSVVSLITDNSGVNMSSADSIVNVLNSLAGKLTYSNFTKDENNLTGYVKIADGLTSSSAAMYTGDMAFSKEDGKGSLKDEDSIRPDLPAPDHQIKNEFTTTLTGVKAKDKEYYKAGVIKEEGLYQFTQNSSITTTNAHGADMNQATTIDAKGKTLTFNTNVTDNSTIHAIGANSTDGVTITADKLVINGNSTQGRIEGINVGGQGQQNKDNPMKLTINGDTEMNIKGVGYTLGLYAAGNSEVTFNGNVTAMGNEDSEWGLTSEKGAYGYYGCSLVYSGSNYTLQTGPKVTINGDVNAKIDGNCLFANGGHAKLTINGGGNIEINKDNTHNYYAMIAESGTTSMNVNLDANYDAISARDNKLVLKGNVGASTGAMNANEPELYTKVNLGLATADSVWTGIAYNGFKDEGNSAYGSDKKFYGAINVFLQNGATWNNEQWGAAVKGFKGSHVAKFVGGSDAAHAGNIFQNDANNITIDNYSGNTNIFYAHTGNGEAASDFAAGDTIIKSAAAGSVVSMITDNSGISMDNEYSVANVLNNLAGKLTYSNFVNGEKNLTGYVKIADGLTASSKEMQTGNIAFNAETGKGSLENGSMKPGFT